ncbi:Fic/DOC family protein [Pauljensenia sp. UMB1177]|uniref:Fic/DOC family protein n=1 Tax=Pauljensenia sp. UMB1177 TaxID=3046323 RepID=UPI00254B47F3|nr:Fic family protein [Pauljensenia sp. UMB1177]MDK7230240.1 Fic family protein [Pauljensenia sp. UMB1177]
MPKSYESWESYFYPETYDPDTRQGTLRNLFGERDRELLKQFEKVETASRLYELESNQVAIERTFDSAHLRALHSYIFQHVYEWAGQYRTVGIAKGYSSFADVTMIDRYLNDAHDLVERTEWNTLDKTGFSAQIATVYALLNQAHPFREGNGRAGKAFLHHVAQLSNYTLRFDQVTPRQWNQASALSGPDLGSYEVVPDSLIPVFEQISTPKATVRPPLPGIGEVPQIKKLDHPTRHAAPQQRQSRGRSHGYGRGM